MDMPSLLAEGVVRTSEEVLEEWALRGACAVVDAQAGEGARVM